MNQVTDSTGNASPRRLYRDFAIWVFLAGVAVAIVFPLILARDIDQRQAIIPSGGVHVGDAAPAFTVVSSKGAVFNSRFRSKPMLLEIYAAWCQYCQSAVPTLNALSHRYRSRVDFVPVAGSLLAADRVSPESLADLKAFRRKYDARYEVYWDQDLNVALLYLQHPIFPTYVLITRHRKVAYYGTGAAALRDLPAELAKL